MGKSPARESLQYKMILFFLLDHRYLFERRGAIKVLPGSRYIHGQEQQQSLMTPWSREKSDDKTLIFVLDNV